MGIVRRRKQRGFVLMMVLVCIIMVGVALNATAHRSLQANAAATLAQRSLQVRWGMRSCQRTLLPSAGALFAVSDRSTRISRGKAEAFPAILSGRAILGGQPFDVIVADEDAKANLNTLYDAGGQRICEQTLSRLTNAMEARTIRLDPSRSSNQVFYGKRSSTTSPLKDELSEKNTASAIAIFPAFRSWGEVFDLVQVSQLAGDDRHLANMTRHVSLYGSGRLNVFRASDETVLAVCRTVVQDGLAKRVLSKLRDTSLGQVDLILEQTITNTDDRKSLSKLLSNSSESFSIWMEATSRSSRHQRLAIAAPDENGMMRTTEYSFE
ncbi:MAG: hypothetical protein ABL921_02850 [Pirellula sp.]